MNRKNSFRINSRGVTADKYGRSFEMDEREMRKRRKPMKRDIHQTKGPDVFPAPNSMKCIGLA